MEATSVVRPDISRAYAELFGTQIVNGRSVNVESLIASLTVSTRATFQEVLRARHALQAESPTRNGAMTSSLPT